MEVVLYPDKVLRAKCTPVQEIDDRTFQRARQMIDCMRDADGVGLAGPQVGWKKRIVTLDTGEEGPEDSIFVNPKITDREGEEKAEEGCLSLPGIWLPVARAERVTVSAYSIRGEKIEMEVEGLMSRAWQHEIDHLNGVLIIDRVPATTRMRIRDKLKKLEERAAEKQKTAS